MKMLNFKKLGDPIKQRQFYHSEIQVYFEQFDTLTNNYNYPALYIGLAYRTRNISIGGRFDLLYNKDESIYSSPFTPFIRVFF